MRDFSQSTSKFINLRVPRKGNWVSRILHDGGLEWASKYFHQCYSQFTRCFREPNNLWFRLLYIGSMANAHRRTLLGWKKENTMPRHWLLTLQKMRHTNSCMRSLRCLLLSVGGVFFDVRHVGPLSRFDVFFSNILTWPSWRWQMLTRENTRGIKDHRI